MNTNFFHNIIKDVKLTWNTILLEDIGQKFSVTYLYVNPNDSFFNGKLIVSQYTDDIHINHTVNIYDYGYVYNYKGLLNISFYAFNNAVKFDILMDCKNIIFDKPYYLGNDANNTNSSFTKQTYINDTLIEKILPKNIDYDFYKYKINKQYNYPCNIPEGFESNNTINYLKKCLLEAEVITYNDTIDYTYELAYLYKNLNTYETEWSNSIQIIRRQKNDRTQERLFSFTNIELLHDNVPGWIEMTIHNDTIRLYIDPTVLPDEIILFISNNTPSAVLQDSDNYYILETCFKKIPRSIIKHNFSRIVYNNYEQIFISRKFDDNNDFIIKFSKCMFNKLMTFQTIGLANAYEKIVNGDNFDVAYNMTSSDNIGPISINGGGWCGGNHSYLEEG